MQANFNEAAKILTNLIKKNSWFVSCSVGKDEIIVYSNRELNSYEREDVPLSISGIPVIVINIFPYPLR